MKPLWLLAIIILALPLRASDSRNTRLFDDRQLVYSDYSGFTVDAAGYLWIGTNYGLLRFDGANFTTYRHDETRPGSISDNNVLRVMLDSKGRMWVATADGLNLYDRMTDSFTLIPLPGLNFNGFVIDLCEQQSGHIVFLVSGIGPYIIDETSGSPEAVRFTFELPEQGQYNNIIDDNGTLIAGTHSGAVVKIAANGQPTVYRPSDTYIHNLVRDREGDIIVTSTDRVWRMVHATDSFIPVGTSDGRRPTIHSAVLGYKGSVLVSTDGDGMYILPPGSDTMQPFRGLYNPSVDMKSARIEAVYQDKYNNLWLGLPFRGIIMAPAESIPFHFIRMGSYLSDYPGGHNIIASGADDSVWVGTDGKGLLHIAPTGRLLETIPVTDNINSLIVSQDGKLYAGIENKGVYRVEGGALHAVFPFEGRYRVTALASDPAGRIYASLHGHGLFRHDPATGKTVRVNPPGETNSHLWVRALYCDSRGRLWTGSYGGIRCLDTRSDRFIDVSALDDLTVSGNTTAIGEDGDHKIWIANNLGLLRIDPDDMTYTRYRYQDGISGQTVSSMACDADGNMWFGTMDGLERFDRRTGEFSLFQGGNGLEDTKYISAAATPSGRYLLFAGERGVTGFNPSEIRSTEFGHSVVISGVFINGEHVSPSTLIDGKKVLGAGDDRRINRINMSYRDNRLTLQLSTMDYRDQRNVTYRWRIPSESKDWISLPAGETTLTIPHLQPGRHRLELAAYENGILSPVRTVEIRIPSPWYLSIPAKIVYALIFLAMCAMYVSLLRKKNLEKANDEKIKFFMNVSHEIRSPMTLILGPLELLMKQTTDPRTASLLGTMHRNANRILSLVNQLLDLRKIDKGKMKIECAPTELTGFVGELVEIFKPKAAESHLDLIFEDDTHGKGVDVWIDRNNFDKVLVNLISNAIKYTPAGGSIAVRVSRVTDEALREQAEITVTDTGIGLDEKTLTHVFDRFYQGRAKPANGAGGFGIGLDLCRSMVTLHHGTIQAANRTDTRGSIFTVRIPLGNSHLSADEMRQPDSETTRKAALPAVAALDAPKTARKGRRKTTATVLIADDDAEIRRYVADVVGQSYNVVEAPDGAEALRIISAGGVDIVVSDIMMPELDGLTLLRTVKSNIQTNHIPVILLTSKTEVADRLEGWAKGADGYIGKPFKVEELQAMIDNLLDNRLRLRGKFSGAQEETAAGVETPEVKGNDRILIDKIVKVINDNIETPDLNVEMLSDSVGISRAHLHRKMKELLGMAPSEFIRNVRLRRACELLHNRDIDITQITYIVGFTSQSHFSTAFKRFTGLTPTEYRQQKLNNS